MLGSLGCRESAVEVGDVLREEAAVMLLRQVTHLIRGVVLRREVVLGSQLVEMHLHVVLQKPGLLESTAADLTAVLKRVFVFPHVTLEEPGLAKGLTAHLTRELAHRFPLVSSSHGRLLPRAGVSGNVRHLHMADELLLVRGGKLAQRAFVGLVQDPDVALQLLLLPKLPLAEGAAEAVGLRLDGVIGSRGRLGRRGGLRLALRDRVC